MSEYLLSENTMNNIKLAVSEGIALVTIDRPKALNALNSETLGELNECLKELEQRKDIQVILLTGGGQKAFVAGADISEMVNAAPAEGRAKELIFTCDRIDAQEAWRIGLVNKVVPQAELLDACRAMAKTIMSKGNYAVSVAKAVINAGLDMDLANGLKMEADAFGLTFATHDKQEGMTAFLEKRPAELTDF